MTRGLGDTWTPPQEFAEYRIIRALGEGAMGKVFLAQDTLLDRPVALKFLGTLDLDGVARERFLIEARALARLQHPNVVAVYRVGELGRRPYLVSEFVHGNSLDKVTKPLPWRQVIDLGVALARGLAAAHRRGVLHRDIKPANTILTDLGEVKLLDFGLAKFIDHAVQPATEGPPAATAPPPEAPGVATLPLVGAPVRPTPSPFEATHDELLDTSPESPNPGSSGPSLTRAGAVMGTPYYMAPEIWNAEPATPRSDIYSLGVLLFELLAGHPPFRAKVVTELAAIVQDTDPPALADLVPGIDPRLVDVVSRCLARDPSERYGDADELRAELEALASPVSRLAIPEGNPYPGLHAFETTHAAVFFGRDAEIGALVDRVRSDTFVLVAGDAGVGKSSVCRAGVAPAIVDGALADDRTWRVVTLVPGRLPALALAAAFGAVAGIDATAFEKALATRDAAQLAEDRRAILRALGGTHGVLVILDQLEDLVSVSDPDQASTVAEFLAELAASGSLAFRLLAAVRGDYLTRAASLPGLGDLMSRALYVLRPMSEEGLRRAITLPAETKQVRFDPESMVDDLVRAAQASGLPLVQFALAELWNVRTVGNGVTTGGVITAAALDGIGGVAGALTRHADRVLDALPERERVAAERMLLALIGAGGARVQRGRRELVGTEPAAERALDALIKGRIVASSEGEQEPTYEVVHDALVERWDRLRRLLDDDGERRIVRRRIEAAAEEWKRLNRSPELLWRDRRLLETDVVELSGLGEAPREFVAASRSAYRRKRVTRVAIAVGIPLLGVAVVLGVRMRIAAASREREIAAARERDARVAQHVTKAEQILSSTHDDRTLRGERATAFAAFDARDLANAEVKWMAVLDKSRQLDASYSLAAQELEHAIVIDSQRDDVRRSLAAMLHRRAQLADDLHATERREELLRRLALYDTTGELVALWTTEATLAIDIRPHAARIAIAQIASDGSHRTEQPPVVLGTGPATRRVPVGDHVVIATLDGREIRYPVRVRAAEVLRIAATVPGQLPAGYVYIPAGRFLVGTADEGARTGFLSTVPLHEARTDAYLIAIHETTFAEWIAFLEALPAAERERRRPRPGAQSLTGQVDLRHTNGRWELKMQPTTHLYTVRQGERLRYLDRTARADQDWSRFPVAGVTLEDVEAYTRWLAASGRLPGARPCSELEWERAARGADDREFPHGDVLAPDEANYDETYGKQPRAFGLDEVGSHPASRSPFGLHDMAGNVFELTTAVLSADAAAARGGAYYFGALTGRATNRWTLDPTLRSSQLGVRVCADPGM